MKKFDSPENFQEGQWKYETHQVEKGDVVQGFGTTMTGEGVECEVLKINPDQKIEVRIMEGKYVNKITQLFSSEYTPTGKTVAEEIKTEDKKWEDFKKRAIEKRSGSKVGDEVLAHGTVITGDGVKARITRFFKPEDPTDDRVEVQIIEGKHDGNKTLLFGEEWELIKK